MTVHGSKPGFSRADVHVHTTFSDGTATPEDVLNYYAVHSDIRVLAITDHDTLDGALHAKRFKEEHPELFGHLDLIIGQEVSSRDGHILGLFLDEWVPPGMSAAETVEAIHAQEGALAVAAHPYTSWMTWLGLVGVGDLIREVPFDAVETRNSNFTEVFANRRSERNCGDKARIGASDGHFLDAVGLCYTDFPGQSAEDLRRAILARHTSAGGSCYGAPTLVRYVIDRLKDGQKIMPSRQGLRQSSDGAELDISVRSESGIDAVVLGLAGELNGAGVPVLKQTLTMLLQARVGVVLDLSEVSFLDSAGITALVSGFKTAHQEGTGFCIAAPSKPCTRTLEVARLQSVLPIVKDLAGARAAVQARATAEVVAASREAAAETPNPKSRADEPAVREPAAPAAARR